jgi:hypothetical protein
MDPGPRLRWTTATASTPLNALPIGSLAPPLPLVRVAPGVKAGDHVHSLVPDSKEQRVRKASTPSAADVSVDNREMLWRCGNPFDGRLDFGTEASGKFRIAGAVPILRSFSSARAAGPKTTDSTVRAGVKLGLKLAPRNAVFPILIETCDALIELGSLGVCHRYILVVQTFPERLDQVEPLARRELSDAERWCFPIGPSSTHTGRARFCGCVALLAHKHEAVFPQVPISIDPDGSCGLSLKRTYHESICKPRP